MRVKLSDRHECFRNAYHRLTCYLEIPDSLGLEWKEKIIRGEYYDGKNLWIYFDPVVEGELKRKIDFKTADREWLESRVNFVNSSFENFLNVKSHDELKIFYKNFFDAFHKTMRGYFVIDRLCEVLDEKLKKVLPESMYPTVLSTLCSPEETAAVRSLKQIFSFLGEARQHNSINFDSKRVRELAEQFAWIDDAYFRSTVQALKNITDIHPENDLKYLEEQKERILLENKEIRDKLLRIFPENHIVWSWISTYKELIRLDNDDHEYLTKGFSKCKPLAIALCMRLKIHPSNIYLLNWLNPESIFKYIEEGSPKDLEKIANKRREGYVLILDGEELYEFPTLSEAQKTYELPNPHLNFLEKKLYG
jgi:hypothetical protein